MDVRRRLRARRLRSAAGSINSGRHILKSRCAERCANDAILTSFRAMVRTSKTDHFFKLAPFWSPLTDLIDFGMAGKLLTSATR